MHFKEKKRRFLECQVELSKKRWCCFVLNRETAHLARRCAVRLAVVRSLAVSGCLWSVPSSATLWPVELQLLVLNMGCPFAEFCKSQEAVFLQGYRTLELLPTCQLFGR